MIMMFPKLLKIYTPFLTNKIVPFTKGIYLEYSTLNYPGIIQKHRKIFLKKCKKGIDKFSFMVYNSKCNRK